VKAPVVTLLSDYGLEDGFVGVCHGVIASMCPQARIIDLTHGLARHDVRGGALILAGAIPYLPVGVHVAIVDPGVGSRRRAVALATADARLLVGPDNGLLWPAAEVCGGVREAVEISDSPLRLEPVSATFHGRDIFAPIAAHLAAGVPLAEVGVGLDAAGLVALELPRARALEDGRLGATVVHVDRFGNVQLGAGAAEAQAAGLSLGGRVRLELAAGAVHTARYVRTFAEGGEDELILYDDATANLALALNLASAAARLGVRVGDQLRLAPGG